MIKVMVLQILTSAHVAVGIKAICWHIQQSVHLFLNNSGFGRPILVETGFSVELGWPSSLFFDRTAIGNGKGVRQGTFGLYRWQICFPSQVHPTCLCLLPSFVMLVFDHSVQALELHCHLVHIRLLL